MKKFSFKKTKWPFVSGARFNALLDLLTQCEEFSNELIEERDEAAGDCAALKNELIDRNRRISELEEDLIEARKNDHRDPKTKRFVKAPQKKTPNKKGKK